MAIYERGKDEERNATGVVVVHGSAACRDMLFPMTQSVSKQLPAG
jgi:hypothetical protein